MAFGPSFETPRPLDRPLPVIIKVVEGTAYTLVAGDAETLLRLSTDVGVDVTFPDEEDVRFPIGTTITMEQAGSGAITLLSAGITLNSKDSGRLSNGQYSCIQVIKTDVATWSAYGVIP